MKRLISVLTVAVALLLPSQLSFSRDTEAKIDLILEEDGSAIVREIWSLEVNRGTEWYLVRRNLGDIVISDLKVWDETGTELTNVGDWNVDWTFEQKKGNCGIVRKSDGCELCWGLGSYGDKTFTVQYRMSNAVKALTDYDALHLQLVSPGIQPRPDSIEVTVSGEDISLNEDNAAVWGFGCSALAGFEDGKATLRTNEGFYSDAQSVILLLRLDKGLLSPLSAKDVSFDEIKADAFEGSDYQRYLDEEKSEGRQAVLFGVFYAVAIISSILMVRRSKRKRNYQIFGVYNLKEIGYERDIPFGGDLLESAYVLKKSQSPFECRDMASAMILKMLKDGQLSLTYDDKQRALLSFKDDADLTNMPSAAISLYQMIRDASGEDLILQDREFSRWSMRHQQTVMNWAESLESEGLSRLRTDSYVNGSEWSQEAKNNARRVIGFKNYLKDFTLLKERASYEVALWQDYIIMAALYGIADKVAKELKDINPEVFRQNVGYDYLTMNRIIYLSNNMGSNITSAIARQTASSVSGRGGFTSFGGGGGFSGGGFGGGVR